LTFSLIHHITWSQKGECNPFRNKKRSVSMLCRASSIVENINKEVKIKDLRKIEEKELLHKEPQRRYKGAQRYTWFVRFVDCCQLSVGSR